MKQILAALVMCLTLAAPALAQEPLTRTFDLTVITPVAPSVTPWISERGQGITSHLLIWSLTQPITSCQLKLEQSSDGVTWTDLAPATNCINPGVGTLTPGVANFLRVNASTITGSGTLVVTYLGFKPLIAGILSRLTSDPCTGNVKQIVPFQVTAAGTTEIFDGVPGQITNICALHFVISAATNVALVADADDNCPTPDVGLSGGILPANGWRFTGSAVFSVGNGAGTVMKAPQPGMRICMVTAGSAQVSGALSIVVVEP